MGLLWRKGDDRLTLASSVKCSRCVLDQDYAAARLRVEFSGLLSRKEKDVSASCVVASVGRFKCLLRRTNGAQVVEAGRQM